MLIKTERLLPEHLVDPLWRLYTDAFEELRAAAVQRQVLYRSEFEAVLADDRVIKYVGMAPERQNEVCGLATFTNHLESMPLISPDYFARRWPDLFAERRIWYIGFFAVHPEYRGTGIFESIVDEMWRTVLTSRGIAALDICRRNDDLGLAKAIHHTLDGITSGVRTTRLDEQSYWLFEPPIPA